MLTSASFRLSVRFGRRLEHLPKLPRHLFQHLQVRERGREEEEKEESKDSNQIGFKNDDFCPYQHTRIACFITCPACVFSDQHALSSEGDVVQIDGEEDQLKPSVSSVG